MRKIIANLKQNLTEQDLDSWFSNFRPLVEGKDIKVEVIIAPSFPYLSYVRKLGTGLDFVSLGSQNVSAFQNGQHTGEVGALQLVDYCKYALVGHSERKEGRNMVMEKVRRCLEVGIIPMECFVHADEIMDPNSIDSVLIWEDQKNISHDGVYSPKDPKEIEQALVEIKKGLNTGREVLYGGSVSRQNASDLSNITTLDGVIVGNASLDPQHFFEIVEAFNK